MDNKFQNIQSRIEAWISDRYDEKTHNEIERLKRENPVELEEAFHGNLEFGTGGLRGIMGVGTNRMNRYTVAFATQGLANYLKKSFEGNLKVAVAYDSRHNSRYFAEIVSHVMSANNIYCYLFDDIRPTPELSFAVRHFGCKAGVMITASHNPKEYNGYKAYWEDGAQLVSPHDTNMIAEVNKIQDISAIKWDVNPKLVRLIGSDVDKVYLKQVKSLSLNPKICKTDISIVYTPLHGTGAVIIPEALRQYGFNEVYPVAEQMMPDGDFPTVKSPNPEEAAALQMAIEQAVDVTADIVLATDPDADRVGVAFRDKEGKYILLNGNETAILLIYYLLSQRQAHKLYGEDDFVVKTIVTTELVKEIATDYNVQCYDVLTGFKYIAEKIREKEGISRFVGGGEESFGYLIGDFVRDKDAVSACCLIAEMAAFYKKEGFCLSQILQQIYAHYGFYYQRAVSITKKSLEGAVEIEAMMSSYRNNPPAMIADLRVVRIIDYETTKDTNFINNRSMDTELPVANVIQFFLEDESKITVRPSGTEPKIKYYFELIGKLNERDNVLEKKKIMDKRIDKMMDSL
ncbi:MAG: phospho-sugar mutase [Bacteroidales bacterium]|jgi:phosphoglucomutase|nr:phospho-sugar mutase [Bacteroidales bacterium]